MKTRTVQEVLGAEQTLFVCATARLSQSLRQRQALDMGQAGCSQWATLHSTTVDQWLLTLRDEMLLRGLSSAAPLDAVLLDSFQERLLWENLIRQDLGEAAQLLFDIASLAKTAMQAHALAVLWQIRADAQPSSQESRRFVAWQSRFVQQCRRHHWVDASTLARAVVDALPRVADQLRWPQQVVWAGFSRFNPVELQLQAFLSGQGVELVELALDDPASDVRSVSYPDAAAECLAAALWVQAQQALRPASRLAIVVPDLAASRHLLQDTLEDVLDPSAIRPSRAEAPRTFNLSLGQPLASYPLVSTALLQLSLMAQAHRVAQASISHLLRTPFWSAATSEAAARARLEAELRKAVPPHAPLTRYLAVAQSQAEMRGWQMGSLLRHWQAMLGSDAEQGPRQYPSLWSQVLPECLQRSGWLFDRKLSSHEFQTRQALLETIAQLGRLDAFMGEVGIADILSQLRRQCQERVFQPKTEGQPSVQVLGLLEASGLNFDGVWVMGMVDTDWPAPARPNPLLPSQAQRQANSPHASAAVQLEFAQKLHQSLLCSAPQVVFSWPRMAGAAELKPSPIIAPTAPDQYLPAPVSPHWTLQAVAQPAGHLQAPIDDVWAPAVQPGERVRGGTWLLRAQAICPAWAYYQYRLGAGRLEEPVEGLDARTRGTFLHAALQHFWEAVQTSQTLQGMGEAQRAQAIGVAVERVLAAHDADSASEPLKPRFRELERERLVRLVSGWIALECDRVQPFEVIANERSAVVDVEGIQARMTIDRIDQLDDGRLLVIDYKTGKSIDTKNWASQRLTEPQLPMYAAIVKPPEGPVVGVVFAKVLMHDPAWAGLAAQEKILPKVPGLDSKAARKLYPLEDFADWASVMQHWDQRIRAVAAEVRQGDAGVRFENEKLLRYCDVRPLLRLSERQEQLLAAQHQSQAVTP